MANFINLILHGLTSNATRCLRVTDSGKIAIQKLLARNSTATSNQSVQRQLALQYQNPCALPSYLR